jgi:hypothetical protein
MVTGMKTCTFTRKGARATVTLRKELSDIALLSIRTHCIVIYSINMGGFKAVLIYSGSRLLEVKGVQCYQTKAGENQEINVPEFNLSREDL